MQGIGPATVARLRPWVCVEGAEEEPDTETATASVKRPAAAPVEGKKTTPSELIDINKASATELRKLPGIGAKLSQAIIDERDRGSFKSVDDLRRVHGIGPAIVAGLRPHVTVGPPPGQLTRAE